MPHQLLEPVSFLSLGEDEDDDYYDSPTPRTSFLSFFEPCDSQLTEKFRRRHSLFSFDSGYFSIMGKDLPIKSFSRKSSGLDLRNSLASISNSTEATLESPKREGVIKSLLRKKKRSFSSSPSDPEPFTHGIPHHVPADDVSPRSPPSRSPPRSPARDPSIDAFEQQDRFIVRRGMKHHPYPREDAPYMLAYDRTLLDNDRYSEILLRRLNQNQSPSFLDFSHTAPKTILDLGCGTGSWAVEAAEFWPSSQVIGFDLVDPATLRHGVESPTNVQWKQGNFVKYKLPFPKNMFDLVRMANLSLCIPYDRWQHVLSEVRRVLARDGRLELIDDYLHFPYTKNPPRPPDNSRDNSHERPPSSSFDGEVIDISAERRDSVSDDDDDNDDDEDFVSTKTSFSSVMDKNDVLPLPPHDPLSEWNRNVDNSKSLEKLFEDMLSRKFSVHPRPSKVFESVIDVVFGRYNQCKLHEFNLYLAPPFAQDLDDSSFGNSDGHSIALKKAGKDFAKWVTHAEYHKERRQRARGDRSSDESLSSFSLGPEMASAKTPGRSPSPPSQPTQSPGLILWPSTFIPIPPFELEMHTCKHLHSLIGSKAALTEFLHDIALEKNLPFDQQMVDDLIWDYESYRRKRFNWPSECLDSHPMVPVPFSPTPRSSIFHNSIDTPAQARSRPGSGGMGAPPDPLYSREKLDFVRSIRVYSATKGDDEIHVS